MYKQNLDSRRRSIMTLERSDGDNSAATPEVVTSDAEAAVRGAQLLGELIGGRQRSRAGLKVNGTFFPLSDILLAGILVAVTLATCAIMKRK